MSVVTQVRPAGIGKKPSPCRFFIPAAEDPQLCLICGFTGAQHHICGKKPTSNKPPLMEDWRNKLKSNGNRTYDVRAELIPRSQQSNFRSKFVPPDKGNNQVVRMAQPLYSPITKPSVSGGTPVLQNSRILSQSQTSAFERYSKSPPNNSPSGIDSTNYVRIGKIDIGKKLGKKTKAVGFAPDDQIVGDNGGCEYFIECENDQMTNGHINGRQPTPPLSPDFDPQTVANTIFNGDLKNFDSLLDAEVGRLIIGEILHIETTGSLKWKPEVSRIPIKHSHSESQVPKPMGNSLAPKPPPRTSRLSDKPTSGAATDNSSSTVIDSYVSTVKVSDIDTSVQQQEQLKSSNDRLPVIHVCDSFSDSNLSSLESSPDTVKELSPAVNDSLSNLLPINESNNEASVPMYTGKKTGKVNRELDSKLLELAKDLESLKTSPTSIGTSRSWMTAGNSTMSAGGLNSTDVRRSTSSTQLATEEMNNFPSLNNSHQMGNSRTLSDEMLSDKRAKVRLSGKFEQQQDNNNANISNAGRFSSIRRFLRIEKSSSDSRFASLSKKWSASFGRKLDINNTSGRPQIFHNVNGPCEATCELSHSDVKVTELLELSVSSPNSSKPNSQPQSPKAPREETVDKSDSQGDVKIDGEMTPVVMNNDNSNNSRKLEPKLPPYKDANINMLLSPDLKMSESSSSLFSYADMEDSDLDLHKLNDSHSQQMELNRYEQLVNINLTSLALISEHLHNLLHVKQTRNQQYKWSQFTLISQLPLLVTEYAAFYSATSTQLGLQDGHNARVNLMISQVKYSSGSIPLISQQHHHHRHSSLFPPVSAEFHDFVPSKYLKTNYFEDDSGSESTPDDDNLVNCKLALLPRSMPITLETYADQTEVKMEKQREQHEKEVTFILIQLLSALKYLQAEGIEEISNDFDTFILLRYTNCRYPHLVILPEALAYGRLTRNKTAPKSLCGFALDSLHLLLHTDKLSTPISDGFQRVSELLEAERSNSLTQSKVLLEHLLWIKLPLSLSLRGAEAVEFAVQTWLDRLRAQTVAKILRKVLRRGRELPDISDELHANFLLHSTVKHIVDNHKILSTLETEIIV